MAFQPVTPIPETDYRPIHPPPTSAAAKRTELQRLLSGVWSGADLWLLEYQRRAPGNEGWAMWDESKRPANGPGSGP
jgi:hypothetical protein